MLISTAAWRALVDAGLTVIPLDAEHVELQRGAAQAVLRVVSSSAVLNPSDIAALRTQHRQPVLLIVPSATPAVRAAVEAAGWSWLVDAGRQVSGLLSMAGHPLPIGSRDADAPPRRTRPGRVPWGTFTLLRRLADHPWATQQQLAALAGVSQPRVSQALAALADQGLVHRTPAGWDVTDIDAAFQWWLHAYPGPGGLRTLWYGLEPPVEQAETVIGLLTNGDHGRTAVSGDVAADFIAPWRSPRRAIVYAQTGLDLTSAGLTPADEDDATLELIVPKDPGVWPCPAVQVQPESMPLADLLQVLWDVSRTPGTDTDEAVQHLQRVMRERRERVRRSQVA
ncbi:MarR family protein [Micromonospora kangleipakensis]|uniref:MarR family protein n=1 Tax=Micromonospora kangleipakensis TaxID=1077942 RepID=A0A4Q8B8U5_9ACTN|nr:MarR family transcriptional regulator [Micromonospora kangleipakensis]RZU73545.1 MarR family protein [Micromonospora kangleipakensis]